MSSATSTDGQDPGCTVCGAAQAGEELWRRKKDHGLRLTTISNSHVPANRSETLFLKTAEEYKIKYYKTKIRQQEETIYLLLMVK